MIKLIFKRSSLGDLYDCWVVSTTFFQLGGKKIPAQFTCGWPHIMEEYLMFVPFTKDKRIELRLCQQKINFLHHIELKYGPANYIEFRLKLKGLV